NNITFPKFRILGLDSCDLHEFPDFLKSQDELEFLVLSHNKITGLIPKWMWNSSKNTLWNLDLSDNFLTGFHQLPVNLPWTNLQYLDLRNNKLQGSLPIPSPSICSYSVSNNTLTGEIPQMICNLSSLISLDLSYNNLSGMLPDCLGNLRPIPHGNQFDTFQDKSFGGNPGLCGSPLPKKCGNFEDSLHPPLNQDSKLLSEFGWKVVMIGYGCGFIIGVIIGQIVIARNSTPNRKIINWDGILIDLGGQHRSIFVLDGTVLGNISVLDGTVVYAKIYVWLVTVFRPSLWRRTVSAPCSFKPISILKLNVSTTLGHRKMTRAVAQIMPE
ncbi:receptor-like protein 7, partial [Quercus suber]